MLFGISTENTLDSRSRVSPGESTYRGGPLGSVEVDM